jgi:hypothetical protein
MNTATSVQIHATGKTTGFIPAPGDQGKPITVIGMNKKSPVWATRDSPGQATPKRAQPWVQNQHTNLLPLLAKRGEGREEPHSAFNS